MVAGQHDSNGAPGHAPARSARAGAAWSLEAFEQDVPLPGRTRYLLDAVDPRRPGAASSGSLPESRIGVKASTAGAVLEWAEGAPVALLDFPLLVPCGAMRSTVAVDGHAPAKWEVVNAAPGRRAVAAWMHPHAFGSRTLSTAVRSAPRPVRSPEGTGSAGAEAGVAPGWRHEPELPVNTGGVPGHAGALPGVTRRCRRAAHPAAKGTTPLGIKRARWQAGQGALM